MGGMLGELPFSTLNRMRDQPGADQGMLAPFEHRAFAREWSEDSPVAAGLALPFAIPAYTAAKALGLTKARSPASMDEVFAGYHGYAEGMLNRIIPSAHASHEQSETVQRPDGKWVNVYGRRTDKIGQQLPGTGAYDTVEEAVHAARSRSAKQPSPIDGTKYINRTPGGKTHGGKGGVRG